MIGRERERSFVVQWFLTKSKKWDEQRKTSISDHFQLVSVNLERKLEQRSVVLFSLSFLSISFYRIFLFSLPLFLSSFSSFLSEVISVGLWSNRAEKASPENCSRSFSCVCSAESIRSIEKLQLHIEWNYSSELLAVSFVISLGQIDTRTDTRCRILIFAIVRLNPTKDLLDKWICCFHAYWLELMRC